MLITESCPESAQRLQGLSQFSRALAETYLGRARATLHDIIADPHLLDRIDLTRDDSRYTRTLLFGDGQMSVWAILWPPGSQTCIHDHHCSCCFGVARGSLKEIWFRAVGDQEVVIDAVAHREPGYVAAMLPTGPNIHQMINDGDRDAVSVHIYGFDHAMHASSIRREYRVIAQ
jgi:predicted metal-dependent enzyme (double-stranded beta helix superfamily)